MTHTSEQTIATRYEVTLTHAGRSYVNTMRDVGQMRRWVYCTIRDFRRNGCKITKLSATIGAKSYAIQGIGQYQVAYSTVS